MNRKRVARTNGVRIGPGQIALTRIPFSLTIWFETAKYAYQQDFPVGWVLRHGRARVKATIAPLVVV